MSSAQVLISDHIVDWRGPVDAKALGVSRAPGFEPGKGFIVLDTLPIGIGVIASGFIFLLELDQQMPKV